MKTHGLLVFIAMLTASGTFVTADDVKPVAKTSKPVITVSKETTWVTEPLDANGRVDYAGFLNRHYGRGVTAETNLVAELYYVFGPDPEGFQQPAEFFSLLGIQPPPAEGKYLVSYENWLSAHPDIQIDPQQKDMQTRQAEEICGKRPWKRAEFPQMAAWLKDMDAPITRAVLASERPHYYLPLIVPSNAAGKPEGLIAVRLPGVQSSRAVARVLCARAMLKLGEGQTLDAWKDLVACHRLGRLIGRGPTLIENLVGIAIEAMAIEGELRVLGESKQAPKLVAGLRRTLQTLPQRSPMAEKINYGERCMFQDAMAMLANGDQSLTVLLGPDDSSAFAKVLQGTAFQFVDWNEVLKNGNQWYDRIVKAAEIPSGPNRTAALAQLELELKELMKKRRDPAAAALGLLAGKSFITAYMSDVAVGLLLPAVGSATKAEDRIEQRWRTLDVALALAAYQSDQKAYPESLDQLVPKYLPAAPLDLFTTKPLYYERTIDGYRCYSFGPNGKDDAGRSNADTPTGDDIIIQMPLRVITVRE